MNERSLVVLIGGGLAMLVAIAVVLYLLLGGGDDGASESSAGTAGNAAASLEGGPDEILYLSGTSLVRRNLEDGQEAPVGMIESPSVYPSHGSHWIAYVTTKAVGGDDDFAAEPVMHLYDPENDVTERYGPGVAPLWNPSGTHVAFLRPVEPRNCQGESCPGDVQIGVLEAATGSESSLLEPGRYSILGWSGEWILVSDFDDPSTITAVTFDDEPSMLDIPASQYWDASPDGRWIVKANAKKTEFVSIEDGRLGDERVAIDLGDYQLFEGGWAHDSSRVAAVVSSESVVHKEKKDEKDDTDRVLVGKATTRIVTFSPDDPEPVMVDGTFGASGSILWSVDNASIVFASLLDPKKALFQAKTCPVGNSQGCEIVTSWTEGVTLLRTE
jgi:hypothetical protein